MGACKGSIMSSVNIIRVMNLCERKSCFSLVPPFQLQSDLVLYADRSRSPGRLQPSIVC